MKKRYLGFVCALLFVGVTRAIDVWEDPETTPNDLGRSFYVVVGENWLFASKVGGGWHLEGVSEISAPAAPSRRNQMMPPRRRGPRPPMVIEKPNLTENTLVTYKVSAKGDLQDPDGAVVPPGTLLSQLQRTQPDKAGFFEIRLTAREQIHLAYTAMDSFARYGARMFIVRVPADALELAESNPPSSDASTDSFLNRSNSEVASSPVAREDITKEEHPVESPLLPLSHPGEPTGPKNRLELARWLTPRCIADLPKGENFSTAAEWITGAVGWWLYQDDAPTSIDLMARAESLSSIYRESPAVKIWWGLMCHAQPTKTTDVSLWAELEESIYAPSGSAAVQWLAAVVIKKHVRPRPLEATSRVAAALRNLGRSFREECATDRERWLVLTLPNRGYSLELPFDLHVDYPTATADFPTVIRDTLVGMAESARGFDARGTDLPDAVAPEKRKQFLAHTRLAREALTRAWDADKAVPYAAAAMLNVCLAEHVIGEPALWVRRAAAAQVDYFSAWTNYFNGRLPRWGGSLDEITQAVDEITAGMRWDSDFPQIFEKAIEYLRDDELAPDEVVKGSRAQTAWATFLKSFPDSYPPGSRCLFDRANSWAFSMEWALLDYEAGRRIVERPGWRICEELQPNYTGGASSFESVRAEVILRSGELRAGFVEAEQAHAAGRYPDAVRLYRQLVEKAQDPATRERLEKRALVAEVENVLGKTLDSPIEAANVDRFFVARQGTLRVNGGLSQFVARPQQHSVAAIWLSSRTQWRLDVTIDVGDQLTAETGVFFGHHNQGAGATIGVVEGGENLRLRQLNRVLIGEILKQPRWSPSRERKFSLTWNGSELTIRGMVGSQPWTLPPQQIEAEPGVWILALTAGGDPLNIHGKSDSLDSPVIREFRFSRFGPDPVRF